MTEQKVEWKIIPALPGFYICDPLYSDEGIVDDIEYTPIVGWFVEVRFNPSDEDFWPSEARPISFDHVGTDFMVFDGKSYTLPFNRTFLTKEGAIEHFNNRKKK